VSCPCSPLRGVGASRKFWQGLTAEGDRGGFRSRLLAHAHFLDRLLAGAELEVRAFVAP